MANVLIYQNTVAINKGIARLPIVCTAIQGLYNKLNSVNMTTSYADLMAFTSAHIQQSTPNLYNRQNDFDSVADISNQIKKSVLNNPSTNLNAHGFAMSPDVALSLIAVDPSIISDVSTLINPLNQDDIELFNFLTFTTETSKVDMVSDYEAQINTKYSIYADTPTQIRVANALITLESALVSYKAACGSFRMPDDIDGLVLINGVYSLDYHRIKAYM